MTDKIYNFFNSFYTKLILGSIILICGIVCGIKLGYSFLGEDNYSANKHASVRPELSQEQYPNVTVGDLFPLEQIYHLDGTIESFESLLKDKTTLLVFANSACEPCTNQLLDISETIVPVIGDNSQIIICYDTLESNVDISFLEIEGAIKVKLNFDDFYKKYNIFHKPTTFVINEYGFIEVIQIRYDRMLWDKIETYF